MSTNPPIVLIKRATLLAALDIHTETLRRWMAQGKWPRPDIDKGGAQQWWHPETLARAGIRLTPAEAAEQEQP